MGFKYNFYSFSRMSLVWLMIVKKEVVSTESGSCLNILLTNDDGYETLLTNSLFKFLRDETCHDVKLVAPKGGQSGKGSSIDLDQNIEEGNPETDIYFLDSTPVTTVLFGLDVVLPEANFKPDLVISGPNEGWNQGWGAQISGTVNGAIAAMTRGYPAIAVSASSLDAEAEDSAVMISKIVNNLIETKLLEDGELILEGGEGLSVNIPTVTGGEAQVNAYNFKLTKIGRGHPIGAIKYFRDLKDSNLYQIYYGGVFNGLSGLGFTFPYNEAGFPLDTDPDSAYNAFGDVLNMPTYAVTVSPMKYNYAAEPNSKIQMALGETKTSKSKKSANGTKGKKKSKHV